jgi:prepilin-type N-terminal cleavage/methylation domain-containing protein
MKVNSSKGFTLIEVMISVVIMAVLSLLTYQAIRTASQNRGKVQELLRNEAKLGDALRVLEHDVSRAFHYRNIHFELTSSRVETIRVLTGNKTRSLPVKPFPPLFRHLYAHHPTTQGSWEMRPLCT